MVSVWNLKFGCLSIKGGHGPAHVWTRANYLSHVATEVTSDHPLPLTIIAFKAPWSVFNAVCQEPTLDIQAIQNLLLHLQEPNVDRYLEEETRARLSDKRTEAIVSHKLNILNLTRTCLWGLSRVTVLAVHAQSNFGRGTAQTGQWPLAIYFILGRFMKSCLSLLSPRPDLPLLPSLS